MKKTLLCFIILVNCFSFSSNAQIKSEIRNYSDSTAYWIENGKKILLNSLYNGDFDKVGELYDYLEKSYGNGPYEVFSFQDALILNMFMGRWDTVQFFLLQFDEYNKVDLFYNSNYYYSLQHLDYDNDFTTSGMKLIPVAIGEVDFLRTSCIQSDIDQEAKHALELLFTYLKYRQLTMLYYTKLDEFYRYYPDTPYRDFLNGFLARPQIDLDGNWGFGGTTMFPKGDMSNWIDNPGIYPTLYISITLHRLYVGGYFGGGAMALQKQLAISCPFQMTFDPGYEFSFTSAALNLGYMMVKKHRMQLTPYASIGQLFLRTLASMTKCLA